MAAVIALVRKRPRADSPWWRRFAWIVALAVATVYGYPLIGRWGPAEVRDLVAEFNAGWQNAPPVPCVFQTAFDELTSPPPAAWSDMWDWTPARPVPSDVRVWALENERTWRLAHAAWDLPDAAALLRNESGIWPDHAAERTRAVCLAAWRGRLAIEERDGAEVLRALNLLWRVAAGYEGVPGCPAVVLRLEAERAAWTLVLPPCAWPDTNMRSYARCVRQMLTPLPPLAPALEADRHEALHRAVQTRAELDLWFPLCPLGRVAGEIDALFDLCHRTLALPLHEQVGPASPVGHWPPRPGRWNLPASLAWVSVGDMSGVFKCRVQNIMLRRGTLAALAALEMQQACGAPPGLLDAVAHGEDATDPYTGRPFVYRAVADAFTLYSPGPDADDDGGRNALASSPADPRAGPGADGDCVFWPL